MRGRNGGKLSEELIKEVAATSPEGGTIDAVEAEDVVLVDNPTIEVEFNLEDYVQQEYIADIENIEEPRNHARLVTESQVENLRNLVRRKEWIRNNSAFGVVEKNPSPDRGTNPPSTHDGKLTVELVLVDGRHRRRMGLTEPEGSTDFRMYLRCARVSLWSRKDGKPVSEHEMLSISTHLNEAASQVLHASFLDRVYTSISACRLLVQRSPKDAGTVGVVELTKYMLSNRNLPGIEQRQVSRFAAVAIRLATSEECHKVFFKVYNELQAESIPVGITHVSSSELHTSTTDPEFCIALTVLRARLRSGNVGNFQKYMTLFYRSTTQLCREVGRVAAFKEKHLSELMEEEIEIAPSTSFTVAAYISKLMRNFTEKNADSSKASKKRIADLRRRLRMVVGENIGLPDDPLAVEAQQTTRPEPSGSTDIVLVNDPETVNASDSVQEIETREENQCHPQNTGSDPDAAARSMRTRRGNKNLEDLVLGLEEDDEDDVAINVAGRRSSSLKRRKSERVDSRRKRRQIEVSGVHASANSGSKKLSRELKKYSRSVLLQTLRSLHLKVVEESSSGSEGTAARQDARNEDEDKDEEDENVGCSHPFDDELPAELPIGFSDPEPYEGPDNPDWMAFAARMPTRWKALVGVRNPIKNVVPYLKLIHIPDEHRANITLRDVDTLRTNHHLVYWRASYNHYCAHPDEIDLEESSLANVADSDREWAAAILDDSAARSYFSELRESLRTTGFCVLEGMLDDARVPAVVGTFTLPRIKDGKWYKELVTHMGTSYMMRHAEREDSSKRSWTNILNDDECNRTDDLAKGRFSTTNFGETVAVEQDPELVWVCEYRALLDVRLGQIMASLKVKSNSNRAIKMPVTGGRWLATSKDCPRQLLHTDFNTRSGNAGDTSEDCPGYFALCSGENAASIWICEGSHKSVRQISESRLKDLGKSSIVRLVVIPPFSVIVVRGDAFHAGAASDDIPGFPVFGSASVRYHVHFVPEGYSLPDGIHLAQNFQPHFQKPADLSSDEE